MRLPAVFLASLLLSLACKAPVKIVKYPEVRNELYTTKRLRQFLLTQDSVNVVLRFNAENSDKNSSESHGKNQRTLVNTIEEQLVKKGFNVKDRTTYNDIIIRSYSSDALKKELSDADLIFEIVELNDRIIYSTDTVVSIGARHSSAGVQSVHYKSLGAYLEFRLILIKGNEIGGIYKFHFRPCAHGCGLDEFNYSGGKRSKTVVVPESLNERDFQQFVVAAVEEVLHSIREG